jgi:Protein of unknown function (DUF3631)
MLLADIQAVFNDKNKSWAEFGKARKPISKNQLARLLKDFHIKPDNVRVGSRVPKGYHRQQFEEAWQRYLTPQGASQPLQRYNLTAAGTSDAFQTATAEPDVAVQNGEKPPSNGHCSDVAVRIPDNAPVHAQAESDDDLEIPASLKRCAQCNAGGDDLEPHRDGDRLVWLHPECVRFWKETAESGRVRA